MSSIVAGSNLITHISFLLCPDISDICKPLFIHTPVKVFEYSRIHPDGSRAELSNHADHMRNAFLTRAKMSRVYTPSLVSPSQTYLFITNWIENMKHPAQKSLQAQLYSQHELFGIGNELSVIKRQKDYVEIFHFYAATNSPGIEDFYLNNIEYIERFISYFKNAAHDLILKTDKDRLLKPWRDRESEIIFQTNNQTNTVDFDKKTFLDSITPKKFFLQVGDREVYLTKREIDCATLLIKGKSNRSISESLFISPRTVETHIESLKIKTNCNDRSTLINFLLSNGFF